MKGVRNWTPTVMNLSDSTSHCAGGSLILRLYHYQTVRLFSDMTKLTRILYRLFTVTSDFNFCGYNDRKKLKAKINVHIFYPKFEPTKITMYTVFNYSSVYNQDGIHTFLLQLNMAGIRCTLCQIKRNTWVSW